MFTLLVWGINMCAPVHAQNKLDSLQHLNEVVVTARAVQKEIFPVQELSGRQLHQLSSHNVADALRYFSGIQIKDYGGVGGLKTVNIRSMGTNHVGVFYDGIELGNAQNGTVSRSTTWSLSRCTTGKRVPSSSRQRISARRVPSIYRHGRLSSKKERSIT